MDEMYILGSLFKEEYMKQLKLLQCLCHYHQSSVLLVGEIEYVMSMLSEEKPKETEADS
jgi:hypothetical protein